MKPITIIGILMGVIMKSQTDSKSEAKLSIIGIMFLLAVGLFLFSQQPTKASPDIIGLRPNGSGTYSAWTVEDSTDWGATSDDSDSTYVWTSGDTAQLESFDMTDIPSGSTITSVTVIWRCDADGGGGGEKVDTKIRVTGNDYTDKNNLAIDRTGFANYTGTTFTNSPVTASTWNLTEVNTMEPVLQIDSLDGDEYIYCSEAWVSVDYSIGDAINPLASFGTNPVDDYNSTSSSITFDLKCSDDTAIDTLELWGNWTGAWHANQTNSTPNNDSFWNITVNNIPSGSGHIWGVWCNDTTGNSDWTGTNRTLNVDLFPTWSDNSTNSTLAGTSIEHRVYWQDDTALAGYIFSFCNGTWDGTDCVNNLLEGINGWYHLNNDSAYGENDTHVYDFSGEGYNGTVTGSAIPVTSGKFNGSFNFTDDGYINLGSDSSVGEDDAPFTVSAWVYSYNWTGGNFRNHDIVQMYQNHNSPNRQWTLHINKKVNEHYVRLCVYENPGCVNSSSLGSLEEDRWYHIIGTYNTTHLSVYVNGSLGDLKSGSGAETTSNLNITIGGSPEVPLDFTNNTYIDEVMLWNRSLSSSEVSEVYSQGLISHSLLNDSWVLMIGTNNWSNVTKLVNSTVGANIAWRVYTNDSSDKWNVTDIFTYNTTAAVTPITVILDTPLDEATGLGADLSFAANVTSTNELKNFSLYHNISGSFILNQTKYPELPNNKKDDTFNELNMTGNKLLFHFNNNSEFGENNTHFFDFSYNGSNGTGLNFDDDELVANGMFDGAVDLEASSSDSITLSKIVSRAGDFSWSFWVSAESSPAASATIIFDGGYTDNTRGCTVAQTAGDALEFECSNGATRVISDSGGAISDDGVGWNCVVIRVDRDVGWNMSFDGVNVAGGLVDTSGDNLVGAVNMRIGARTTNERYFDGRIDELAFWDRHLSDAEAIRICNVTKDYNVNYTVTGIPDGTYKWNVLAWDNESNSDWATNNFTFTVTTVDNPPQWFDNSTNSTVAGTWIEHRVRWTDASLAGYIFSFDNGTGSFTNDSFVSMTGVNNWSNVTKSVNITVGANIAWRVYANDSENQWNSTDMFTYNTTSVAVDCWIDTGTEVYIPDGCDWYIPGEEFVG